ISAACSFSLLTVSRNVHNLFTGALVSASPAGLRLEIAFKIDKKKMKKKNFIFHHKQKFVLTGKQKPTCPSENKKKDPVADLSPTEDQPCGKAINRFASLRRHSRFDRIGTCTQFFRLQTATGVAIKMRATHTNMKNGQAICTLGRHNRAIRQILSTTIIALLLSAAQAYSVDELLPPFGFRWNDSMAHVEAVLHGAKAKITSREKKENRDVWTVEGLIHPGLKRTLFTFKQRALVAVELQYEYPDWSIERYNQRMGEIRKYFDEKYGTGKLVSRSRDTDTDVIQTLVGYQWMVGATMLELFYFSAQHGPLLYRTITVDYKAM